MFQVTHRSSSGAQKLHYQPLVLHTCEVVGRRGCQTRRASDKLDVQQPHTYAKPEVASAVLGFLMMSGVSLETCWSSYTYGIINSDTLLHLVGYFCMSYTMMHGSTNIKLINELGNQDSLVNMRSRLQARRSGVWTQVGKREFSVLQQRPHWP